MRSPGRSLELYFIDGRPDGMLTAEVFNWTGHVLRIPRLQIVEGLKRPEAGHTGVYLLIDEEGEKPRLYVGEAEDLRQRLRDHVVSKGWWNTAVLITTAGDALHKAHVKYLESRLVEIARETGKAVLENGNTPPRSSLSEAAVANMEGFLETLKMVLPAIGIGAFDDKGRAVKQDGSTAGRNGDKFFEFVIAKHGLHGKALVVDGEVVVLKGSLVRGVWIGDRKHTPGSANRMDELIASGVIDTSQSPAIFTKDIAFSSPSLAAEMISGRSSNGRREWKHKVTGQTYAEWEQAQIAEEAP